MIERKIYNTGSVSEFIIKNHDMTKTISTKKQELLNITRSFGIFVSNPCCVLTQEDSKKFIQASDFDKYSFFLRATGLQQAQEEYAQATELLMNTRQNQKVFDETLAIKKQTFDKAKDDLEKWSLGETIEYDISLTTAKKSWCSFYETENIVNNERRRIEGFSKDLADAEGKLSEIVAQKNAMLFGDKEIEREAEELSG